MNVVRPGVLATSSSQKFFGVAYLLPCALRLIVNERFDVDIIDLKSVIQLTRFPITVLRYLSILVDRNGFEPLTRS